MKFGTIVTGQVARFAKDGSGEVDRTPTPLASDVCPPSGRGECPAAFHVYNTIPGETVTGRFVKRTKEGPKLELVSIDVPSPSRVEPRCPLAGTCGGCKWQHVDYPAQLQAKLDTFHRIAAEKGVDEPALHDTRFTLHPAPEIFYYRNRMDFVFGENGELGLKAPDRWWDTLDLPTCFLLSPESVEIVNRVRVWAKASGLPFWNVHHHNGFFRYLVIREGKRTGERMVMLVTAPLTSPASSRAEVIDRSRGTSGQEEILRQAQDDAVGAKLAELPALLGDLATSVVWGINPLITDLSVADELIPLKGDPWIHEQINGITYKITPNAFFQTNTVMAEQLQNQVKKFCGNLTGKTLLDLFCGSGFFSLFLASSTDPKIPRQARDDASTRFSATSAPSRVIGIELSTEAIACAKENVAANGFLTPSPTANCQLPTAPEYFTSKSEDFDWKGYAPDVVILDPPRAGLHPDVIETLLEVKPPRVVYVSCSYPRFLDEWKKLSTAYRLTDAAALDLFPHTPHMECVFLLERI